MKLSLILSSRLRFKHKFVDSLRIYVRGGGGGQGLAQYGGHGGRGGNILVEGTQMMSLLRLIKENPQKRFVAKSGENSSKLYVVGKPGKDVIIKVPLGVCIKTDEDREIGDINKEGETIMVSKGGRGGGPWNNFMGERAPSKAVRLELKLIADIGLVGFPNAGKSSLLKAVSRANPKVAEYAFTTIKPNIGVIQYEDLRQISVADLPGLIEGAHMNIGMGHNFLKHVERTKMLIFLVDIQGFKLGHDHIHRSAIETVLLLNKELELYKPELLTKPAVLILNKIDIDESDTKIDTIKKQLESIYSQGELLKIDKSIQPDRLIHFDDVLTISAKEETNIDVLKQRLRGLLDHHAELNRSEDQQMTDQGLGLAISERTNVELTRDISSRKQLQDEHYGTEIV